MKFDYKTYATVSAASQTDGQFNNNRAKVGFFKLADGESALVRFAVHTVDNLEFATVHRLGVANHWAAISCLKQFGSHDSSVCPLCKAVAEGNTDIAKASARTYVEMLVRYFDKTTGQPKAETEAVIFDRPSGFAREISSLINDYGDLTKHVFKVTRTGSRMTTKYSVAYIPIFDKPEIIAEDFSAFDGFDINKHLYWEKTADEMNTFLTTGQFPERAKTTAAVHAYTDIPTNTSSHIDAADPAFNAAYSSQEAQEQKPAVVPTRNFSQFKF